jgi:hypothetical protein
MLVLDAASANRPAAEGRYDARFGCGRLVQAAKRGRSRVQARGACAGHGLRGEPGVEQYTCRPELIPRPGHRRSPDVRHSMRMPYVHARAR